jgi:hypothetical protein
MPPLPDHRARLLVLAASLGVAACNGGGAPSSGEPRTEVANSLESLAVESGALDDLTARDPVGSYGRTYEGGRDRLCIVPDDGEGRYRFGAEMRIGDEGRCSGSGTARYAGDRLIFNFAGGTCLIVARYEGDRIVMPGAVDVACASLCSDRGSLAGVTFPRTGHDQAAARRAKTHDGDRLCG